MRAKVPPDIEAAAMSDLYAGEQPAVVAQRYQLNQATVRGWKKRIKDSGTTIVSTDHATDGTTLQRPLPRRSPKLEAQQVQIGERILDLLAAKIEASTAIAKAASNPEWIAQQSAADLALFGEWLDASALAIGDRLAAAQIRAAGGSDPDSEDDA